MTIGLSSTVRNSRLSAIVTAAGASAVLTLYSGTRPATGGTATTALSAHTCSSVFGTVASGVLTFNAVGNGTASSTGTATWARLATSGGTFILDMDVSTSGGSGEVQMPTTSIVANATVTVSSGTLTEGNA